MRTLLIIVSLLTTFVSCQTRQLDSNSITSPLPQSSIIDSLNNHIAADSLFKYHSENFYVGKLNGQDIALYQSSDTTTSIYQRINGNWKATDTLLFPLYYVQTTDLNGDSNKDVIVTYNVTGAGGNSENASLIYYPAQKQFRHNRYFDLPNISYDTATNLIHSAWWASSNHPQNKMMYTIIGDSLTFKEGVTYQPDEITQGEIGTVEFYNIENYKRVITKKIKGKSEKTFDVFTYALWDSSDQ